MASHRPFDTLRQPFQAQKGHIISFIFTPRNLLKLPEIPSFLISRIYSSAARRQSPERSRILERHAVSPPEITKKAFDLLELPFATFLESTVVDWVIYDYASHWLPSLAIKLGVSRAFFSCLNAACMSFIGPPTSLIDGQDYARSKTEDFTVVPPRIPFDECNMSYRYHKVAKYVHKNVSGTPDTVRFRVAIRDNDVVLMRSSDVFDPEWFELLRELYGKSKPVLPIGFLPLTLIEEKHTRVIDWLDKQRINSVVYVAIGTEATLSQEELTELALGLELSRLSFFWGVERLARVDSVRAGDATTWIFGTSRGPWSGTFRLGATSVDTESRLGWQVCDSLRLEPGADPRFRNRVDCVLCA